ncbi:MAG: DUF4249 domain-containing protein [Cyclobacteriaceae bacterium]|nr:DUF4249 domain-containing protein [Cyclobacteriaceae bacterium]
MIKYYNILKLLLISLLFSSACETIINPNLESAEPILVIDAWINNKAEPQVISLSMTQPYFENVVPPPVEGAQVSITDSNGKVYVFTEAEPGAYTWTPVGSEVFGETGLSYELRITANGESYISSTKMGRVPPIDSITFLVEEGNQFVTDLYLAEFWAVDPLEAGDSYRIKAFKNGNLLNKPSEMNLAYDAGFSKGGGTFTGITFISPIRTGINPFDQDENKELLSPYVVGDSVYVELHSLTDASFDFLTQVALQTDRPGGFSELFSTPLANVSSNVRNDNPNGKKVVGFFNVASVSGLGRKFASLDDVTKQN